MPTNKKTINKERKVPFIGVKVKFVKAANMYCKTWFDDKGIQRQEWSAEQV